MKALDALFGYDKARNVLLLIDGLLCDAKQPRVSKVMAALNIHKLETITADSLGCPLDRRQIS